MESRRETSLDRFMQTRGTQMLGYSTYRISSMIQIGIGGALTLVGIAMLLSVSSGADSAVAAGAMGPLIGGAVNFAVGMSLRRRFVNDQAFTVPLSPEAKALLIALHRKLYGWRSPWAWQASPSLGIDVQTNFQPDIAGRIGRRRARRMAIMNGFTPEMVPENIEDDELTHLDAVAAEYNRTLGALESAKAGSATLSKLGPRILKAADEAMADALHQAAMLVKFPEGGNTARARLEAQETALRELADRVETMATGQPNLTDRVAYRSSIDDVLDELRMEQLARSELRTEEDRSQDLRA